VAFSVSLNKTLQQRDAFFFKDFLKSNALLNF